MFTALCADYYRDDGRKRHGHDGHTLHAGHWISMSHYWPRPLSFNYHRRQHAECAMPRRPIHHFIAMPMQPPRLLLGRHGRISRPMPPLSSMSHFDAVPSAPRPAEARPPGRCSMRQFFGAPRREMPSIMAGGDEVRVSRMPPAVSNCRALISPQVRMHDAHSRKYNTDDAR